MKKILIRSGISPLDVFDAPYMIENNSIGGNVGNLIYAYSVYRTLGTKDVVIDPDYYSTDHSDKKAEEINRNYDCYVIPFADAFRPNFIPLLRKYTKLIKKLTIPVIIVGVGLRAPFEPRLNEGFPFDKDVQEFVSAVLEKSSMIGVRGQITADYLTRLGFEEEKDHTVIGCPSMYSFGSHLKIKELSLSKESTISFNSSLTSPENVLKFIDRSMNEYENHYFIPQWLKEMILTYVGSPSIPGKSEYYPKHASSSVYMNNRVKFFLNAPTWIDFMSNVDLSVGARLHGNVTATIAGTPSIIIPKDARMRELAEYHDLTRVMWNEIGEETSLEKLVETLDFHSPEKVQKKNFEHFINFLDKNELNHIYKDDIERKEAPLDAKIDELDLNDPIIPISGCTTKELISRIEKYEHVARYREEKELKKKVNKSTKGLKKTINEKDREIKHLKGTLNRKSARIALGIADKFSKK